jgi:hypothetical protein
MTADDGGGMEGGTDDDASVGGLINSSRRIDRASIERRPIARAIGRAASAMRAHLAIRRGGAELRERLQRAS